MLASAGEQGTNDFPVLRQAATVGPDGKKNGDTGARVLRRHADVTTAGRGHRRARSAMRMVALLKHKFPSFKFNILRFEHAGVPYYLRAFSQIPFLWSRSSNGSTDNRHVLVRVSSVTASATPRRHRYTPVQCHTSRNWRKRNPVGPPGPAVSLSALLHLLVAVPVLQHSSTSNLFDSTTSGKQTKDSSEEVLCLSSLSVCVLVTPVGYVTMTPSLRGLLRAAAATAGLTSIVGALGGAVGEKDFLKHVDDALKAREPQDDRVFSEGGKKGPILPRVFSAASGGTTDAAPRDAAASASARGSAAAMMEDQVAGEDKKESGRRRRRRPIGAVLSSQLGTFDSESLMNDDDHVVVVDATTSATTNTADAAAAVDTYSGLAGGGGDEKQTQHRVPLENMDNVQYFGQVMIGEPPQLMKVWGDACCAGQAIYMLVVFSRRLYIYSYSYSYSYRPCERR